MADSTINFVASFKAGAATAAAKAFRGELGKLHGVANSVGDKMLHLIKRLAEFALVAGTALVAAVGISTKKAEEYGITVAKVAAITGLAVDASSRLVATFQRYGLEGDAAIRTVGMLEKNVGLYTSTAKISAKFTAEFGFALRDSSGHVKDANALILQAADYFNNKHIPASQRALLEAKLFGRQWQTLVPVLALGSKGIKEAGDEAQRLGLVLSKSNAADLLKYRLSTIQLTEAMGGLQLSVGLAVMPALVAFIGFITGTVIPGIRSLGGHVGDWVKANKPLIDQITAFVSGALTKLRDFVVTQLVPAVLLIMGRVGDWFAANKPLIAQLTGFVSGAIATGIQTIVDTFKNMGPLGPIIGAVTLAVLLLSAAVRANPIVAAILAIITIVGLLRTAWDNDFGHIREVAHTMFTNFSKGYNTYLAPVFDAIGGAIGSVVMAFTGHKGSRTGGRGSGGLLGAMGDVAGFMTGVFGDAIGALAGLLGGHKGSRTGGRGSSGLLGTLGDIANFLKGPLSAAFHIVKGIVGTFTDLIVLTLDKIGQVIGAINTLIRKIQHVQILGSGLTNYLPNNIMGIPIPHAAGGWVGLKGPEIGLLGEKGPEYILSNDQLRSGGGSGMSGGGSSTTINFTYAPATSTASAAEAQQFSRAVMPEFIREARRQKLIA